VHERQVSSLSFLGRLIYRLKIRNSPFFKEIFIKRPGIKFPDQHGGYSDIPQEYLDRKIVSIIRNPHDLLISHYTYGWWRKNSVMERSLLEQHFPEFPDLSLMQYVDYRNFQLERMLGESLSFGFMTHTFVRMFFKDPPNSLKLINSSLDVDEDFISNHMAPVHLLDNRNLNQGLFDFLKDSGYKSEHIDFILEKKKVNATKTRKNHGRENLIGPEVYSYFEEKERLLYRMLEILGFRW
jgi:hypothetical protein